MIKFRYIVLSIFFYINTISISSATHIRAGEILIERISVIESTYAISVIVYSDRASNILPGSGTLNFGDGRLIIGVVNSGQVEVQYLDNQIAKNTYSFIHTYTMDTGVITVSYQEINRNPGIMNMANSVNTPFYIESSFLINTPCESNNTPVLLIPPVDFASAGQLFIHNPGAFDKEGDSISYQWVVPKQSATNEVADYSFPENVSLNPTNGNILWMAPYITGEYNIALKIQEWRLVNDSPVFLSSTVRDMQIIVVDNLSNHPQVIIPGDTCLQAGDFISGTISVIDNDGNPVKIECYSEAYFFKESPAYLSPDSIYFRETPFHVIFSWNTLATHIKNQPYKIHFKATDNPELEAPLTDIKTWNIKVSAPAPDDPAAELLQDGSIKITWNLYAHGADKIQVRRRVTGYSLPSGNCFTGVPDYSWYDLVAEVDANSVSFVDQPSHGRFARGAQYCYRLLANIPGCSETESTASNEACVTIPVDAPAITNVSVINTGINDGSMYLRWTSSFDRDISQTGNLKYNYQIRRTEGISGKDNPVIISPENFTDTVLVDSMINTRDKIYYYTVFLFENEILIDSSAAASSIKLVSEPVINKIGLKWNADVPWSINTQKYPYHYVYRNNRIVNNPDGFYLIDSVNVNYIGFHYIDSTFRNVFNGNMEYCYYIVTQGSYGNPKITEPLINYTQKFCAFIEDTIPPCAPQLQILDNSEDDCYEFLSDKPCDFSNYFNDMVIIPVCTDPDVVGYHIYFSSSFNQPFEFVGFSQSLEFRHEELLSFAGCYKVSAIDFSGNESEIGEVVCRDNCPLFELPNVFTPNEDGFNDFFTEFNSQLKPEDGTIKCPRFVKEVEFQVYNRFGRKVYNSKSSAGNDNFITWNGSDHNGRKVVPGVYYYYARIYFDVLNPADRIRNYKGWIEVLY